MVPPLPNEGDVDWADQVNDIINAKADLVGGTVPLAQLPSLEGSTFLVTSYGAVGDGVADDTAALHAAVDAAEAAGGGVVDLRHPTLGANAVYLLADELMIPGYVDVVGHGGAFAGGSGSTIRLTSSSARVRFGDNTSLNARGGISQGFLVDGDTTGDPTGILVMDLAVHRTFISVSVVNGAGDGWVINASQNCLFMACDSANHDGIGLILDNGAGGLSFVRCESVGSAGGQLKIRETPGGVGAYPWPAHNDFKHCIFECYRADLTVDNVAVIEAGSTTFHDCGFASNAGTTVNDGYLIMLDSVGSSVLVHMSDCLIIGTTGESYTGVELNGVSRLITSGDTAMQFLGVAWKTNDITAVAYNYGAPIVYTTVTTQYAEGSAGALLNFLVPLDQPQVIQSDGALWTTFLTFRRKGEAGARSFVDVNGAYSLCGAGSGSSFTIDATFGYSVVDDGAQVTGGLRVGNRFSRTRATQTISSNSAVTIDAKASSYHRISLQANITSMTITNATDGCVVTIEIRQDAAGGRTTVWPTNARFNANSAPGVTTGSTNNNVTLSYDSLASLWYEQCRSVNMLNS